MALAFVNKKEKCENYHIQVFARIRPFTKKETQHKQQSRKCFDINGKHLNLQLPYGSKSYNFERIFDNETSQDDIYKHTMNPIVRDVMKGYNCSVLAYGASGTGKTFTLFGSDGNETESDKGFLPRAVAQIFDAANGHSADNTIRVSFMEIYNEVLTDLLSDDKKTLRIHEDRENKGSVNVQGLEEVHLLDKKHIYKLLESAAEKRKVASTYSNQPSSRSHFIFTVIVHITEKSPLGEDLYKAGRLTIVDLAASDIPQQQQQQRGSNESIQRTGTIMGETNQGLSTLVRVMRGLLERTSHMPYKESKLTRILQDSLGGKTKTTIIATLSPNMAHQEETMNTLEFVSRARHIITHPEINQSLDKKTISKRYQEEIERLRRDLLAARNKTGVYLDNDNYNSIIKETEENREKAFHAVAECSEFGYRIEELEHKRGELEEVYVMTQAEMASTKDALEKFRNGLDMLRAEKCIRTELINRYEEAETEHIEHSKVLCSDLDSHIREHNILRTKIDNVYSAMERNDGVVERFANNYKKVSSNLNDTWGKLKLNTMRHLENDETMRQEHVMESNDIINVLRDDSENIRLVETEAIVKLQQQMKIADEICIEQRMKAKNLSEEQAVELKKLCDEQFVNIMGDRIAFEKKFEDDTKMYNNTLARQYEMLKEYDDEVESETQFWHRQIEDADKILKDHLVKVENFADESKVSMTKLSNEKKTLEKLINAAVKNVQHICEEEKGFMDTFTNENKLVVGKMEEQKTKWKETSEKDRHKLVTKKEAMDQLAQNGTAQRTGDIAELIDRLEGMKAQFARGMAQAQTLIDQNHRKMAESIESEQVEQEKLLQTGLILIHNNIDRNEAVHEAINTNIETAKGTLDTYNEVVTSNYRNINETTEQSITNCFNICAALSEVVKGFTGQFEILKPNGDTPGRKNCVKYPSPRRVSSKMIQQFNVDDLAPLDESTEDGIVVLSSDEGEEY